jgi:2-polyprenyl-3-methyl-5-hydroxy-6-metoxy-1,4-benzoquinol methylase
MVWGIEPNAQAAAIARDGYEGVIEGSFTDAIQELSGNSFDCIVFNDVLEHMVNPETALQRSRDLLAEGGYIIASIPNILFFPVFREIIQKQDWKYEQYGILDNTHLRFFTRKSITRLFEENGFRINEMKGISQRSCGRLYRILNTVFYRKLDDWKFMQFGVRATPRNPV